MGIERIDPDGVYTPVDETYSQAVKASGDTHVHVSGMLGLDREGEVVSEDMREQTAQVLAVLSETLDAAGADVSDLVRIRLLTTDAEEYMDRCHELVAEWYGEHKPASTLHEVAGFSREEFGIEIEATALVDG